MTDEAYIRRAIRLAMNGRGRVEPNPMVGCVLVKDGRVIGEGYHGRFGGPHAEPTALADCAARGESPAGATAYVTLEPCCHTDKKTPPCAPRLIEAKVARVVIGCLDPNPQVNGNGVAMLRAAGIRVDRPEWDGEAKQLIAPFLARVNHGRPYVTLKWAETADGYIGGPGGKRLQISNAASSHLVHQLRARSDAILVGIKTVLADDPMLTARGVPDPRPLRRGVLDPWLEIPLDGKLVASAGAHPLTVFCGTEPFRERPDRVATLRGFGAEVVPVTGRVRQLDLQEVLSHLGSLGATHLLVESGGQLASSMTSRQMVDRTWVFRSPTVLGDPSAFRGSSPNANPRAVGTLDVRGDTLSEHLDLDSDAFFAHVPSADFVLAAEAADSIS